MWNQSQSISLRLDSYLIIQNDDDSLKSLSNLSTKNSQHVSNWSTIYIENSPLLSVHVIRKVNLQNGGQKQRKEMTNVKRGEREEQRWEKERTHLGLSSLVQCMAAETDRALCGRHLQHPCNTCGRRSLSVTPISRSEASRRDNDTNPFALKSLV